MSNKKRGALYLFALGAAHFAVSGAMALAAWSPYLAGYHNGQGLWNFGGDSFTYHLIGVLDAQKIAAGYYSGWIGSNNPWHTKLIALTYYLFGPNPFSFELFNAFLWAGSILVVYMIFGEVTGGRGKIAAAAGLIYGLFPSNLLLSTQLLKDPFFNLGVLAVLYGWITFLTGRGKTASVAAAVSGFMLCAATRFEPIPFMTIALAIATALVAIKARQSLIYAAAAMVFSLAAAFAAPAAPAEAEEPPPPHASDWKEYFKWKEEQIKEEDRRIEIIKGQIRGIVGDAYSGELDGRITFWFRSLVAPRGEFEEKERIILALARTHGAGLNEFLGKWIPRWEESEWLPSSVDRYARKANEYRDNFLTYYISPEASVVDNDVVFRSVPDMIRYIPRAMQVGFMAPFPRMWLSEGQTGGRAIRLAAGVEMAVWYVLIVFSLYFLAHSRAPWSVKAWLFLFAVIMITPLGVFVPNLGTLHRMRHVYMTPVLICGMEGGRLLWLKLTGPRS